MNIDGMNPKAMFMQMDSQRTAFLGRCEEYARWTIPATFPLAGQENQELMNPWHAVGPRLVNNLANKMMMALFSPSRPFFRLMMDDELKAEVIAKTQATEAQIDEALAKAERKGFLKMGKWRLRTSLTMLMQQLVVVGNGLLYVDTVHNASQAYSLRDYVVKRDLSGIPILTITRDRKHPRTVPEHLQQYIPASKRVAGLAMKDQELDLYTVVARQTDGSHKVIQSFDEVVIPETLTEYKKDACPWIHSVWKLPRGWDYGVGMVEEYAGDFHAINEVVKAVNMGVGEACDIKKLVNPAGMTDVEELNTAVSGAYVSGSADDISIPTLGVKVNDFQFALALAQWHERRLGEAFLLNSAVTRDAERVTAEEIRIQAAELETSHAGIYSRQAEDIQLPLSYLFMNDINVDLAEDRLEPVIVTGMDALSRMSEQDQLMMFMQDLAMLNSVPPDLLSWIDPTGLIQTVGANRGVDYSKFLKSPEQKEADDKRAMQMQAAMAGGIAQAEQQAQPA